MVFGLQSQRAAGFSRMTLPNISSSRTAGRGASEQVILSDFDGTMLMEDTSVVVLNQFGEEGWERTVRH
jgi:hypothetical protein